jgi:hypothetical protein
MQDPNKKVERVRRRDFKKFVADNADKVRVEKLNGESALIAYETDGEFDYELYKEIQTLGNKFKLDRQWVGEDHIAILSQYINASDLKPKTGICHGTRQGFEQKWFRDHLAGDVDVIGTEISDTATQFEHTIQWDFHETKPEWEGNTGFIYSNSWDHSFDPKIAFTAWAKCLAPGGFMFLDHGIGYDPEKVSPLDPFGISREGLVEFLNAECGDYGQVKEVIDGGRHRRNLISTVIFHAK